ncbi:GuaB1 family IMP dehydrogenase-related protein [Leucobacter weissii]|uniref:GMP reductase n=1 Tax=Leucobacter weissii TaxID=1983706 RepID=A0A939MHH0_9MICO|nr:GuaB1 family IMP dehydrogenase-related protein [Leucobacter weissii]MBO1901004.1 GuaB1 family IMP dehydrogenase-related protein [Leucobacter weissii]
MQFIGDRPTVDLTYSDVFLVPGRSAVRSRLEVDLSPGDGTPATIPLVAANMNAVSGPRLAAALARRGGLAVLPQDLAIERMIDAVGWVKRQPIVCDTPLVLSPDQTAAEALRLVPPTDGHGVVVGDGAPDRPLTRGQVRGVVAAARLAEVPEDARLGDLLHGELQTVAASALDGGRAGFDAVLAAEERASGEPLAVFDGDLLRGTVTSRSALRSALYRPAVDDAGRLGIAAAVGINGDVAGKARALADAGADVLVLDTAHGHQDGMIRALETVAGLGLGLPLVAGNVVTAAGVRDLVTAGATIIKVGVGPGAMCTTRMMTAVGRPQFSAVLETAEAARALGAHVWADGGVRYPRDVALALAAGADSVMIGSWFAGTVEAPGRLSLDADGRHYKESWGMASTKAVQARFGGLDPYERARKELFAEGISSSRIYLDPQRPGVEDLIDMITSGVRSSFSYAGAVTLPEFHERARVGLQSAAGYEEGKALPVSW